jgi:hypothetical protein
MNKCDDYRNKYRSRNDDAARVLDKRKIYRVKKVSKGGSGKVPGLKISRRGDLLNQPKFKG